MIEFREKIFGKNNTLIKNITSRLDKEHIEDYEVSNVIPDDVISINSDLGNIIIYMPEDYEYTQYEIDDYVRSLVSYMRTSTRLNRNIFEMRLSGKITEVQYFKIIKKIIELEDFCTIINED